MGSMSVEELTLHDGQEPNAQEEKIFVAVRLRPLNEKEIAKNDASDWECISSNTIIYKNSVPERSLYPTAYTFDRVYGCDNTTKQVYEKGAKRIALSVVGGINSSIFAYGQTSSGKTYTMSGITEYAIADIYDYINKKSDREFVLKFSAMEIYNECVRDLLSGDSAPLRLLDDPEKGTVVEKLTEVNLRDWNHLKELLCVCEAERQIGETSLNEMSSRSHQILRLTVESSAREFKGADNASTLSASVNFVDLAGSERASQTLSAGTRLKEGCHINRSLLTLGTVVRKLSKGRNSHVPYRDSKLTRILQNSLGGNARTAIICTMSPAHSHVEQSRNTLLFAICAKEVSTNAQVNVVMSEKALVKQLQRELARLENELRVISDTNDYASIIKEKDLQIRKMEKEITELTQQRDLAQSHLEDLLRVAGIDQISVPWVEPGQRQISEKGSPDGPPASDNSEVVNPLRFNGPFNTYRFPEKQGTQNMDEEQYFFDDISPSEFMNQYFGPDPCQGWEKIAQKSTINSEDTCKDVRCIENSSNVTSPEQIIEDIHKPMENVEPEPEPCSSDTDVSHSRSNSFTRNTSSEKEAVTENTASNAIEIDVSGRQEGHHRTISESKSDIDAKEFSRQDSHTSVTSVDDTEMEQKIKSSAEGDDVIDLSPTDISVNRELSFQVKEDTQEDKPKANESEDTNKENVVSYEDWPSVFEKQRREIIQLWDQCNIPLLHRTYFFLLIKGDASDSVYMEVELRRLSFLKKTSSRSTSARALNRERLMLAKKLQTKYSSKERDALFQKWGIKLDSKHRRVQLSRLLWTKINDIEHAKDSAEIVARLVGLLEPNQTPKELFGLSFAPKQDNFTNSSWKNRNLFT